MSNNSKDNIKKNKDLDQSQDNQKVVGDASDNPETTGPAENLREEAVKQQIILATKKNRHKLLCCMIIKIHDFTISVLSK